MITKQGDYNAFHGTNEGGGGVHPLIINNGVSSKKGQIPRFPAWKQHSFCQLIYE